MIQTKKYYDLTLNVNVNDKFLVKGPKDTVKSSVYLAKTWEVRLSENQYKTFVKNGGLTEVSRNKVYTYFIPAKHFSIIEIITETVILKRKLQ